MFTKTLIISKRGQLSANVIRQKLHVLRGLLCKDRYKAVFVTGGWHQALRSSSTLDAALHMSPTCKLRPFTHNNNPVMAASTSTTRRRVCVFHEIHSSAKLQKSGVLIVILTVVQQICSYCLLQLFALIVKNTIA